MITEIALVILGLLVIIGFFIHAVKTDYGV